MIFEESKEEKMKEERKERKGWKRVLIRETHSWVRSSSGRVFITGTHSAQGAR